MERKLLLLGLLRDEPMHAYQLSELIETHLGSRVQLTKPTIYRLLEQMAEEGWIVSTDEQNGNRPARRVYAITPQGEAAFLQMLQQSLSDYSPPLFPSAIGLAFLSELRADTARELLRQRQRLMSDTQHSRRTQGTAARLDVLADLGKRYLDAEWRWLGELIAGLDGGCPAGRHRPADDMRELGDDTHPPASRPPARPRQRKQFWSPEMD